MLNALVGYSGMIHTYIAAKKGIDIALANKESLVVGGKIIKDQIANSNSNLFPVDSEHSAIYQCLHGEDASELKKIIYRKLSL